MDEITPYNLPPAEPPVIDESAIYDTIQNTLAAYRGRVNIGAGNSSMHVEKTQGQWQGAEAFADAPFSVTMTGDVVANSITVKNSNSTVTLTAGESITAGNAVCLLADVEQLANNTAFNLGDLSANTQVAVKFIPKSAVSAGSIDFFIKKTGAPADNFTYEVQTDSSGAPSGTPVTNGTSNNLAGGSVTTNNKYTTLATSSDFSLTAGTTYWVVFKRSGAVDAANYYTIQGFNSAYGNFTGATYNGSAWSAATSKVAYFELNLSSGSVTYTAWKTDSDILPLSDFIGFANATVSSGASLLTTIDGVSSQLSGLTTGAQYYPSSTAGGVATSRGTFGNIIGLALSSTQILIQKNPKVNSGIESFSYGGTGNTEDHYYNVGFRPRIVYFEAGGVGSGIGESRGTFYSTSNYSCIFNNLGSGTANAQSGVTSSYIAELISAGIVDQKTAVVQTINNVGFAVRWSDPVTTSQTVLVQWHAIG